MKLLIWRFFKSTFERRLLSKCSHFKVLIEKTVAIEYKHFTCVLNPILQVHKSENAASHQLKVDRGTPHTLNERRIGDVAEVE